MAESTAEAKAASTTAPVATAAALSSSRRRREAAARREVAGLLPDSLRSDLWAAPIIIYIVKIRLNDRKPKYFVDPKMLEKAPNELPFEHLLRVWALAFDKELPLSKLARIRRCINDLLRNMCPGPITSVDTRSAIALHLAVAVELYPWTNRVIEGVYEGPGGDFIGGAADVATFEDRLDAQGSLILCLENFVAEYSNGQSVYLAGVLLDPASLEATGVHPNIGGAKFYIQEIAQLYKAESGIANPIPVHDDSDDSDDSDDQDQRQAGTEVKYRAPGFVPPSQCGDPTNNSKRQRHL